MLRMDMIGFMTYIISGLIVVMVALTLVPVIISVFEQEENEKIYGERLDDYDLEQKRSCQSFCGSDNVYFKPSVSTFFSYAQEVCQCQPRGLE